MSSQCNDKVHDHVPEWDIQNVQDNVKEIEKETALYVKEQTLTDMSENRLLSFLSVCMRNIPIQYCDIVSYLPSPWRVTSYFAMSDAHYVTEMMLS